MVFLNTLGNVWTYYACLLPLLEDVFITLVPWGMCRLATSNGYILMTLTRNVVFLNILRNVVSQLIVNYKELRQPLVDLSNRRLRLYVSKSLTPESEPKMAKRAY